MYRKRWSLRALGMDLQSSDDGPGRWKPIKMICVFLLSVLLHGSTAYDSYNYMADNFLEHTSPEIGPYFDTMVLSNVTGLAGETVQLACRVKNLGNRTVSWVRHRDIHLLTVGRYTYTSDQRFEAMHKVHTEEWILRIRYPQRKDSGIYECQISTTPPIGHPVHLTIVEPVTEIAGGPDLYINKDSTINLTCYVRNAPEPPSTIIWSHNHQAINFDSPRGGISLVTEKGPVTSSRLLIQKAIQRDSGLYTCSPNNTHPNSVRVHIVNEEHPAAMHHGSGDGMAATSLPVVLLLWAIF
ncbi:zwei Ig domain protein zig-8 isoform X1 [Ooceraea biroi]|uniref:zwei Ig domain protein zig-8 isoform X1 n=1 Tax=Ooceraea biroi TaxID=2015173 RepID=UPI0005B9D12B|nr:zwei Ig domain protein zig-8 isoform X1 [Ooceraea biroi]XP_011335037.1 zwei Ig domain protein zig-8 isoform X1 [Ooceraea biroi]XP_011335038.1 zwei Ig domain protein zig-8 isoform X1 [Ooceraea biroi]XP_019886782.1 zwei Ig domain protein zig-8 isoform X1 [Ooceraea biroi]XP_019886784.1 zwei Ig domain protein zig-8 isoform X1 [Ooceraea biroi]XP_019886786.1 zwei Ig domain protein zig-8 isoform X1 [Ooceraea biroi]XP_019886787.1 zwei Ig domain protein zig-8 isoform X1 [Ooceraea biroi]XP_02682988